VNEQKLAFLRLLADRAAMANERARGQAAAEHDGISPEEAKQLVTDALRRQLVGKQLKSSDRGMKVLVGLLSLDEVFPSFPPSETEINRAIERSNVDYATFQAVRMLVVLGFPESFASLRSWRRSLMAGILTEPPLPKGPSRFRDAQRNMILISQIHELEKLGFSPTRGAKKNGVYTSGCDIVAAAVSGVCQIMTYEAIEAVWKSRSVLIKPEILALMLQEAITGSQVYSGEGPPDE
jgi:hypothetical protein